MQTTTPDDDVAMMQWCVEHAPPLPLELSITPVSERTSAFASLENVGELDGAQKTSAAIAEELGRLHAELKGGGRPGGRARRRGEGAASLSGPAQDVGGSSGSGSKRRKKAAGGPARSLDEGGKLAAEDRGEASPKHLAPLGSPADQVGEPPGPSVGIESHAAGVGPEMDESQQPEGDLPHGGSGREIAEDGLADQMPISTVGAVQSPSSSFWARVEPHFAPLDLDQVQTALFGGGGVDSLPQSTLDNYLARLRASWAVDPSEQTGDLSRSGICASSCLDVAAPMSVSARSLECESCSAEIPPPSTARVCASCSTKVKTVFATLNVHRQRSALCEFSVGPGPSPARSEQFPGARTAVPAIVQAVRKCFECCLAVDRAQLQTCELTAAPMPVMPVIPVTPVMPVMPVINVSVDPIPCRQCANPQSRVRHTCSRASSRARSTADAAAYRPPACRPPAFRPTPQLSDDIPATEMLSKTIGDACSAISDGRNPTVSARFSELLADFRWNGVGFTEPLTTWDVTKLCSRLANLVQVLEVTARSQREGEIGVRASLAAYQTPTIEPVENEIALSEIEREAVSCPDGSYSSIFFWVLPSFVVWAM